MYAFCFSYTELSRRYPENFPNHRKLSKSWLIGGKSPNREKIPNRMLSISWLVGGKSPNREKIPNRMLSNSKLVGEI